MCKFDKTEPLAISANRLNKCISRIILHAIHNTENMYSITELRVGTAIQLEGKPYVVTYYYHSKQARGGGIVKVKLKNLIDGANIERTFQGNDKIDKADVGYSKAQYLYGDGSSFHFMDSNSYEQFELNEELIGDNKYYLIEGEEVDIQNFDGKPINVMVPPKINLTVTQTEPGVKGDTASGGSKPATTNTGLVVQVPLFIKEGEKIRVNTQTGEYCERAN